MSKTNGRTSRWDYDAAGQLTRQNYTDVAGMHILVNVNANSGKREHLRLPKHCPPLFVA
ncbi:RHS repeat domain-containing protein [Endozoicomonas sp. ALB091]|uniref:RHS repeat domain-containing protein n=1 Tax=Endozoicomonas sp. ALB091 TaxID=3403073 RepID=UPI003BB7BAC6